MNARTRVLAEEMGSIWFSCQLASSVFVLTNLSNFKQLGMQFNELKREIQINF
jgi:hypothetical protein